ncbi:MAG: hypothetical protein IID35_08710, partial [Planctomycetes bacterium]|nr:hypothetical protein [Planctomycetota bacterium]
AADAGAVLNTAPEPYSELAGELFQASWLPERTEMLVAATNDAARRMPAGNMGAQVRLWNGKLSKRLARKLEREGVLKQEGDWFMVDGFHAGLYMTCLAGTMAESMGVTCCTDRAFLQMNSRFFCGSQYASDGLRSHAEKWLSFALKLPTIEGIATVPMKKILRFREKHIDSRRELRIVLSRISALLGTCDDENAAQDIIR